MTRQQRRAMERKANKPKRIYQSYASRKDKFNPIDEGYKAILASKEVKR